MIHCISYPPKKYPIVIRAASEAFKLYTLLTSLDGHKLKSSLVYRYWLGLALTKYCYMYIYFTPPPPQVQQFKRNVTNVDPNSTFKYFYYIKNYNMYFLLHCINWEKSKDLIRSTYIDIRLKKKPIGDGYLSPSL